MADEYGDLVELGIEGVDRLTDKYHDKVYGFAAKKAPTFKQTNKHPPPGPPPQQGKKLRSSSRAQRDSDQDRGLADYEDERRMYAPERRRDGGYDEDRQMNVDEKARYSGPNGGAIDVRDSVRDRERDRYALAPRVASPPYGYDARPRHYEGNEYEAYERGRPHASRYRAMSYSPPRHEYREERDHSEESKHRRKRSRSPNHHRVVATLVGALAGGLVANAVKKGDGPTGTLTTVAGAVIGGISGHKMEQEYDRHKEKRYEEEERRERREQRRRERDYSYY
ncbi:hypothetical protein EJ04DRAFT_584839 [Polyplosphaeria fusca]|uniref:Glycine zipper 2TM domain-containing protein n=1 Tax=Polyplosphaeria fusca TaxID=682080 RepID=A0A9P4QQR9_9PLEO|nr:hypothetical protein EJ04DRAFT_584839 [Polyplosphaeria fusca]